MEPPSKLLVVLYHKDKVLSASNVFGLPRGVRGPPLPVADEGGPSNRKKQGASRSAPSERGDYVSDRTSQRDSPERKIGEVETRKGPHLLVWTFSYVGVALSFQGAAPQVFSALMSLTAVFGMGTGGPSSL